MGDSILKKVFAGLGVIVLIAALGIAIGFAFGSHKSSELQKDEAKVEEKEKTKKEKEEKQQDNNTETADETNSQEQAQTNAGTEMPQATAPQNDTTTQGNAAPPQNNQAPSQSTSKSSDSAFDADAEYAKQKEMYEKAARGEIPEPGADLSGDNAELMERDPSTLTNDEAEQRERRTNAMESEGQ